ncbi:5-formyltetrahydrofolate cyclo-ligase [Pseudidiomarina sp. CB1]|uniref:5-formyltetrahydrofolate cyclo-ligase n=1 Tax=Pseudidiomarina sp. CB1 TaxID=2972484 RepID=UPI002162ED02|nr:5-formyltetrahydrofolate cyclo-ligase [Pseudidiomarina sp. CB1]
MNRQFTQNSSQPSRQQLRRELLAARKQLSAAEREQAAAAIEERVLALAELQQPCSIGSYYSVRAELPTHALNQALQHRGHHLAFPVLHPIVHHHLLMLHIDEHSEWCHNNYGIPEPKLQCQRVVPLQQLNVLLVPLVGFDAQGNRMGMGGGFYDRTLAGWRAGLYPNLQPIGLAYDCQFVERLPCEAWDVPLPRVITPTKVWDFRS